MATTGSTKRLLMDIKNIKSEDMESMRIYYNPVEENIQKGTALFFGPEGTIYQDLPIFLELDFPYDYPFVSPKVKFVTSDGKTRFHPNLYIEGKVCLSILGTWNGPSWTSVMNLRTVLLSIMGLLDNEPILHEPGYTNYKGTQKSRDYSSFVEHACICYIVNTIERFSKNETYPCLAQFKEEWLHELPNIYKNTLSRLIRLAAEPIKIWSSVVYNMSGTSHYSEMLQKLLIVGGIMKL